MIIAATYTDIPWNQAAPVLYRGEMQETFRMIREDGFEGVEMHIHDSSQEDPGQIRSALDAAGLTLTSIGTGTAYGRDHLSLSSPLQETRSAAVCRIKGHIDLAGRFPGTVVILGLIRGKLSDSTDPALYWDLLSDSLADCGEYAQKRNVTLVLEAINRHESDALRTADEGLAYLKKLDLPAVRLHLDTYHMSIEEENPAGAILKAGSLLGHVHAADADRWYPGHDQFDFGAVFSSLKKISYQGAVAVEALCRPDMRTAGQKSASCLNQCLCSAI